MTVLKKLGLTLLTTLLLQGFAIAQHSKSHRYASSTAKHQKANTNTTDENSNAKSTKKTIAEITTSESENKSLKTPVLLNATNVENTTPSTTTATPPVMVSKVTTSNPNSNFKTTVTTFIVKPATASVSGTNDDLLASRKIAASETKKESSFATGMMDWLQDKYSNLLEVLPNQISNVMLYRFIDDWYGTKYRMGGTTKKGVDCSSFVQQLYQYVFGMNILRTACMQFGSAKYINNICDLKEGDLVFFHIGTSRISHVGVYLRNNFFVHSASSKGVSIANLNDAYWAKYFAGGGRIVN